MKNKPDESLYETFIGEKMTQVRRDFLAGKWPKECWECEQVEKAGQYSKRQETFQIYRFQDFFKKKKLTERPEEILELDISMGRLCNLKCRMCNSEFSSKWEEDAKSLFHLESGVVFPPAPLEPEVDFESLLPHLQHCKEIIFKGGEPTLHPKVLAFVKRLVDAGVAGNIRVCIVTNLTTVNKRLYELLAKFKEVLLVVSVDGLDPLFRYIRHGRFTVEDIKKNLELIKPYGFMIKITTAFQIYNMLNYAEIVRVFKEYASNFGISYVMGTALNPQHAPKPLREEAIRRLKGISTEGINPWQPPIFQQMITFLENGSFQRDSWEKFKEYTHALDKMRDESIARAEPIIGKLLSLPDPENAEITL